MSRYRRRWIVVLVALEGFVGVAQAGKNRLFAAGFLGLTVLLTCAACPQTSLAQTDPNNDPNWDWRADATYTVYLPQDNGLARATTSPFLQGGMSIAVQDNNSEDGWLLLMRDFGAPNRGQPIPHVILYNRYQGLLRIFVYIETPSTFSDGAIELFHGTDTLTALLTFVAPRAWAPDELDKIRNNRSIAPTPLASGYWSFADFPIAYDPYLRAAGEDARLFFRIWGIQNFGITLTGRGDLRQVFGQNQPSNIPSDASLLVGQFSAATKQAMGTFATWSGWQDAIKKTADDIEPGNSKAVQRLKKALTALAGNWTVSSLGLIGAGVGLVDFLVTGGRHIEPAPMNFQLGLTLDGTMETRQLVSPGVTLPVPGSPQSTKSIAVDLLYDQPLGIFNLLETPVIQYRPSKPMRFALFVPSTALSWDIKLAADLEKNIIPAEIRGTFKACIDMLCYLLPHMNPLNPAERLGWWLAAPVYDGGPYNVGLNTLFLPNTSTSRLEMGVFLNQQGLQLQVKENLLWQVNPAAGLILESLEAAIVFRAPDDFVQSYLTWSGFENGRGIPDSDGSEDTPIIELESATNNAYLFRSPYVDARSFRFRRIDLPYLSSADIVVKVKAILRRKDAPPDAQPVVFVATYQPRLEAWNLADPWPTFDLNYDGCIDRTDLDKVLSVIRGQAEPDPFWELDVNGDSVVNIADARALVTHFNRPGGLPCGP